MKLDKELEKNFVKVMKKAYEIEKTEKIKETIKERLAKKDD